MKKSKVFKGKRVGFAGIVTVDGKPLPLYYGRKKSGVSHSPTGFAWGYGGSGPHQLAYAILRKVGLEHEEALRYYHQFCWEVVAKLPMEWVLTETEILSWLAVKKLRESGEV